MDQIPRPEFVVKKHPDFKRFYSSGVFGGHTPYEFKMIVYQEGYEDVSEGTVTGKEPPVILREFLLGITHGVVIGCICAAIAGYLWGNPGLGFVVGLAMLCNLIVASTVGAAIPLTLRKFGVDPAQSSTIFLTMVTDTVGFLSFLGLAKIFWGLLT